MSTVHQTVYRSPYYETRTPRRSLSTGHSTLHSERRDDSSALSAHSFDVSNQTVLAGELVELFADFGLTMELTFC